MATVNLNVSGVLSYRLILSGTTTLVLLDGFDGQTLTLIVSQDAVGSHSLTFANASGTPTIATAANSSTIMQLVYDASTNIWTAPTTTAELASKIQTMRVSYTPTGTDLTNSNVNLAVSLPAAFADTNYSISVTLRTGTLPAWQANHVYATDAFIQDPNGNIQIAQAGGTSGGTIPTFSQVDADTGNTTDGGVTWLMQQFVQLIGLSGIVSKTASGFTVQIFIGPDINSVNLALPFIVEVIAIHD